MIPGSGTAKIEQYTEALRAGFIRVLAVSIRHKLYNEQTLTLELTSEAQSESIVLTFLNVAQLRLDNLHPGTACYLAIRPMASDQWEAISYQICSLEQDFTLSFFCRDFEISGINPDSEVGNPVKTSTYICRKI
jgi:hypothetical protein